MDKVRETEELEELWIDRALKILQAKRLARLEEVHDWPVFEQDRCGNWKRAA